MWGFKKIKSLSEIFPKFPNIVQIFKFLNAFCSSGKYFKLKKLSRTVEAVKTIFKVPRRFLKYECKTTSNIPKVLQMIWHAFRKFSGKGFQTQFFGKLPQVRFQITATNYQKGFHWFSKDFQYCVQKHKHFLWQHFQN